MEETISNTVDKTVKDRIVYTIIHLFCFSVRVRVLIKNFSISGKTAGSWLSALKTRSMSWTSDPSAPEES